MPKIDTANSRTITFTKDEILGMIRTYISKDPKMAEFTNAKYCINASWGLGGISDLSISMRLGENAADPRAFT
jgi:hypothetical protein